MLSMHPSYCSTAVTDATNLVRFQILTAVTMKITIFWYVTPCSPIRVCRRFAPLLGFALRLEHENTMFLRNVSKILTDYMPSQPKSILQNFFSLLHIPKIISFPIAATHLYRVKRALAGTFCAEKIQSPPQRKSSLSVPKTKQPAFCVGFWVISPTSKTILMSHRVNTPFQVQIPGGASNETKVTH